MVDHMRARAGDIERLYLDFDSFFAAAEQHFNPVLRGRPVGVVPFDSPNTGCIAISREAKALGLKGNVSIAMARAAIPDMVFVVARHDVYVRLHHRILQIIESCLPIGHVRSIDELVCELLPSEAAEGQGLADRIKRALSENFSDVLTCSIGMAPTELLAKIAAEKSKPNGFAMVRTSDLPNAFRDLELRKLPGISDGIERRLAAANVFTFTGLWALAPKQARAIWGNVEGERFWNELHGYHAKRPQTKKRMFGHSRVLPMDWRSAEKVGICARQLCLSAGRRLRRAGLQATKLTLSFRGGGYRMPTAGRNNDLCWAREYAFAPAQDDQRFLKVLHEGLMEAGALRAFKPCSVSVMLHGLVDPKTTTGDLFDLQAAAVADRFNAMERRKWERVSAVMDQLRQDLGPEAISLGPRADVPGGYLGAKIAFGRIPDRTDFNNAPVPDEETHFCSFQGSF